MLPSYKKISLTLTAHPEKNNTDTPSRKRAQNLQWILADTNQLLTTYLQKQNEIFDPKKILNYNKSSAMERPKIFAAYKLKNGEEITIQHITMSALNHKKDIWVYVDIKKNISIRLPAFDEKQLKNCNHNKNNEIISGVYTLKNRSEIRVTKMTYDEFYTLIKQSRKPGSANKNQTAPAMGSTETRKICLKNKTVDEVIAEYFQTEAAYFQTETEKTFSKYSISAETVFYDPLCRTLFFSHSYESNDALLNDLTRSIKNKRQKRK